MRFKRVGRSGIYTRTRRWGKNAYSSSTSIEISFAMVNSLCVLASCWCWCVIVQNSSLCFQFLSWPFAGPELIRRILLFSLFPRFIIFPWLGSGNKAHHSLLSTHIGLINFTSPNSSQSKKNKCGRLPLFRYAIYVERKTNNGQQQRADRKSKLMSTVIEKKKYIYI